MKHHGKEGDSEVRKGKRNSKRKRDGEEDQKIEDREEEEEKEEEEEGEREHRMLVKMTQGKEEYPGDSNE